VLSILCWQRRFTKWNSNNGEWGAAVASRPLGNLEAPTTYSSVIGLLGICSSAISSAKPCRAWSFACGIICGVGLTATTVCNRILLTRFDLTHLDSGIHPERIITFPSTNIVSAGPSKRFSIFQRHIRVLDKSVRVRKLKRFQEGRGNYRG